MKATVYAAPEPGLKIVEQAIELNDPKDHEILIQITHCGVGRGDVGFLKNTFQVPNLNYPLVAGHELIGKVVSCGEGVKDFAENERVGVGYQVWSCGTCDYCMSHKEQYCQQQKCLVQNAQGGFASHIVVDERFVFKIPNSLESAATTPLLCSGLTVYSAIKHATIEANMKVGVIGIGGLGHMAVQILHHLHAQVTAFSSKKNNVEAIMALGANEVVGYESTNCTSQSFDHLFVTTAAPISYDYYLNLLKPDGNLWIIGSATDKTTFSSWLLNDFAGRSIRGSYIGSPDEMRELLAFAEKQGIKGSTKVMPMGDLHEALKMVDVGSQVFRIVVTND
jgi:uncharacterized zinc-type alcohol dehydrogenase-like protein